MTSFFKNFYFSNGLMESRFYLEHFKVISYFPNILNINISLTN